MQNIWIVIKHEVRTTLEKRSFWFMTFIFPLVILGINVGTQLIAEKTIADNSSFLPQQTASSGGEAAQTKPFGLVDHSGIIQAFPPGIPTGYFTSYPDDASARSALNAGKIDQYILVSKDYLQTGEATLVSASFQPLSDNSNQLFEYLMNYNLVKESGGSLNDQKAASLASTLIDPSANIQMANLAPTVDRSENNPLAFIVPFATMFVFFFLITMSSGYMLQSVTKEKEDRTVEVLLVSIKPRDLMLGKILALSIVAIFQLAIWLGGSVIFLNQGKQLLTAASGFELPPGFIAWGVVYFTLGYLLYASLMAAIGALAPSSREGNQFTFIVLLPLMIPLWMNAAFMQAPNGLLATILSLFPLTAPTSMMTRMASANVPFWQLVLSALLLGITTYVMVLMSARFFKADTLLSGEAISLERVRAQIRKKRLAE